MKVEGTPKPQGTEARRFTTAKPARGEAGGKSFREALRKAAEPAASPGASSDTAPTPSAPTGDAPGKIAPVAGEAIGSGPQPAIAAEAAAEGRTKLAKPAGNEGAAAAPEDFANHMELVKLRLKSGYYSGSNIDEALSDRLTGYFDELA